MIRDVRTRQMHRQAFRTFADATLRVTADADGQILTSPSKVVNCA